MRAYCEAATPGPWTLDEHYQSYIWGPRMQMIADDGGDEEGTLTRMRGVGANLPLKDNGIFIARVRIDFPRVLADLESALQTIGEFRRDLAVATAAMDSTPLTTDEDRIDWLCDVASSTEIRLERVMERIAKAPHTPDCASNTRRQVIPFETFTAATCKSMFGCGHCEKCRWIQNNQVFTSGKCNCWKSEVRGR